LHDEFGGHKSGTAREEMVQIAAVALQIIEYYDRHCACGRIEKVQPALAMPPSRRGVKKSAVVTGWTGISCQRSVLLSALTQKSFTRLDWQFSVIRLPASQRAP
jgi:hypothetical protein